MPGYAYPVGTASVDAGNAGSTNHRLIDNSSVELIFTATLKTKITSILLTNNSGGILPVDLSLVKSGEMLNSYLAKGLRVHKRRYAVQSLVSGDTRVDQATVGDSLILTELVLEAGDSLYGKCPVENAVDVTVNYLEGIN